MNVGPEFLEGYALGAKSARRRSFELGITTRNRALIDQAARLFQGIWEGLHCPTCGRRNVCPVRLEEPGTGA